MDEESEIAALQARKSAAQAEMAAALRGEATASKFDGYDRSIAADGMEEEEDEEDDPSMQTDRNGSAAAAAVARKLASYTAPRGLADEMAAAAAQGKSAETLDQEMGFSKPQRIVDRENEYRQRRLKRDLSPARNDAFAAGDQTPDSSVRTYADIMRAAALEREKEEIMRKIALKKEKEKEAAELTSISKPKPASASSSDAAAQPAEDGETPKQPPRKRNRWDVPTPQGSGGGMGGGAIPSDTPAAGAKTRWDIPTPVGGAATPGRWDMPTPTAGGATPGRWDAPTPGRWDATSAQTPSRRNRWDETPTPGGAGGWADATPKKAKSRWDETQLDSVGAGATPLASATPTPGAGGAVGGLFGATPVGGAALQTPTPGAIAAAVQAGSMTPDMYRAAKVDREMYERNKPISDEELDAILPKEGYKILHPPASYVPIRTPARKLTATPTPLATPGFHIPEESQGQTYDMPEAAVAEALPGLPGLKPEDYQHFGKLLDGVDEETLTPEEANDRRVLKLLLKVKNGTPPQRKAALRQLTDKARQFGPDALFSNILALLRSPTLEDQERHLLVKVIDRVLYKLDDMVRPYVHKILVVIEPLLIEEDYYARVEGREIISNLAKAAGLAAMIAAMRPDIDSVDEYVRNTTARAFSVVASALGIPSLLPFLKAVCQSRKSWQARHTGIKIVQQIAILMGCAVLPHLRSLVDIIEHGLNDDNQKVRTITALALAALSEAAAPYGIESFDSVLKPLWKGIKQQRGKALAAFLKAVGFIIPLMDAMYANYYTREVMVVVVREFNTPDEDLKKIILKVVKQCSATDGVEAEYIRTEILPEFFAAFWIRRMAEDRRNHKAVVETTVELSKKVGGGEIIGKLVGELKDGSEAYRRMVMDCIDQIIEENGAADIDARLEEQLVDGILFAFQEQTAEEGMGATGTASSKIMLNGFGKVVNALGERARPYLPQIAGTIKWRLNNRSARVRQQAADLISRVAAVMQRCEEEGLLGHLGVVLYEYLGEEYPEVLGSILGALKAIVNVVGMSRMTPPIKDLLPRLTPILKNRHEKVQENCIDLVGRIADRGAEFVPAREWMRICFELLEMLKAHKKGIRRAAVNTFGYIAKAIGPQDVLATLLNNLRVQERQNRVCTTVAIAIVAETCSPFTVLPALMNEYRVPELNVQNGVLKALSFMFEYIGEMGKDYIYAVVPLLTDALMDRDLVHRQTAASTVKHIALGVPGLGCEDGLTHLMNLVWPNIFETSPHLVAAVQEAIEGFRVSLGPGVVMNYALQGLFHPARRVREVYWKIYNNLYIGAQDALVSFYPHLDYDKDNGDFHRHEIDVLF